MKRICSILILSALVASLSVSVFAAQPVNLNAFAAKSTSMLSTSEINRYKNAFTGMTDDEFDRAIITMIKEAESIDVLRENLSVCGVELNEVAVEKHHGARTLDYNEAEIVLTSARRSGQSYYHLVVGLEFSDVEIFYTTLDGLALYFDSRKADYVGYNSSTANGFSLRSGQQAVNGTLVFNFDDSLLYFRESMSFYTAVYAEPHAGVTEPIVFGADYCHTYGDTYIEGASGAVGFTFGTSVTGSVTVNFSVAYDNERSWSLAELSDFN